jgi:catechol 2,3-dioxygenase
MALTDFGVAPPSFRLPGGTTPGRVVLQVSDLQRSIAYYTDVIGLHLLSSSGGVANLGADGASAPFVVLRERPGATRVPRRGLLGLYHFAILLPDRPALGRFVRHLGGLGVQVGTADHAVSESLYLTDPDGLGIEIYADRPRALWQVDGAELHLTVEPLDVPGLIRDGSGAPWTNVPDGTAIGHVHLYVGSLDQAETFYHSALGFDKTAWSFPGALFLAAGGYHHHLGTNTWAAGQPAATGADARLLEWELVLPDAGAVSAAARSVESAGYRVAPDGHDQVIVDPWGTSLRLRTAADS